LTRRAAGLPLAAVGGPAWSGLALRDRFNLGCGARRGDRAGEASGRDVHDPDRQRRERAAPQDALPVAGFDRAASPVLLVVQRGRRLVEPPRDAGRERLRLLGRREHDEVIATDVAEEPLALHPPAQLAGDLTD